MKTSFKIVAIMMILGLALVAMPAGKVSAAPTVLDVCPSGCTYSNIQDAVSAAVDSDTISISGTIEMPANVDITKDLTISCDASALIKVSGTGYRFSIIAGGAGTTIDGCKIEKTDKTGEQNIIWVNASNVTISNNTIWGKFVIGDGEVSRAIITSAGNNNITISKNTIYDLRQPAYFSGPVTGTVSDNYVYRTKGWVIEQGNMTFTGNTWGTGADANVYDIAILSGVSTSYYTNVLAMATANNNAFIEDQRTSPATLSTVYVDGSVVTSGDGTARSPKKTISEGVTRVIAGGTINVAAGTYPEQLIFSKSVNLLGPNAAISPNTGTRRPEAVVAPVDEVGVADPAVLINAGSIAVTLKGFKFDMGNTHDESDRFVELINKTGVTLDVEKNIFTNAPSTINGNWYITGTTNPFSLILDDNYIHHNGDSNGISLWGDGHTVTISNNVWKDNQAWAVNFNHVTGTFTNNQVLDTEENGPEWWNEQAGFLFASANNLTLTGNTMDGLPNPYIRLYDSFSGPLTMTGNDFVNSEDPLMGIFRISAGADLSLVKAEKNNLSNSPLVVQNMDSELFDASPNWWGSAVGPAISQFSGPAVYIPWCLTSACDTFGAPVVNITKGTYFATIQSAIDDSLTTNGDVIQVAPGVYTENVNVNKGVTLLGLGENRDFSAAIATSDSQAPGKWYTDRYKPAVFESSIFNGEAVLKHGVRAPAQSSSFYNSQGRKLDVNLTGPKQTFSIDLWVDSSWTSGKQTAGLWGTGFDSTNSVSAYPILLWRNNGTDPAGFYGWDYAGTSGYIPLITATPEDYGRWHTFSYVLTPGVGLEYMIDGVSVYTNVDTDTVSLANVILNVYNFGADYDVYWDNFATYDASIVGQMTISASNVKVDGFDMSNPGQPYGVLIEPAVSGVQITHNRIHDIGGPSIENPKGVYLRMGPDNVTLEGNIFSSIKAGIRSANAIFVGDSNSTDPSTGLIIRNNSFVNITAVKGAYGILLNNGAAGTGGGTPAALIEGNRFTDLRGGWTHAIGLEGPTANAVVLRNFFSGLSTSPANPDNVAVWFEDNPVGASVAVTSNQFLNNSYGVAVAGTYTVNASPNWWGLATGPVATQMGGTLTTSPWCAVPDCSILNPHTVGSEGLQKVLDTAPSYTTIIVPGITYSDGSSIGYHIDTPHLTIILKNGTVIQNNSPCFTVNASYTTITTESIGGAKCIPTGGSNGIDVNAGLVNVILQGMEIDGTGQSTGAGINFAGAIEDVQVLDNNIHNLGGDGLKFNVQPLNVVDIRGNMFKSNTGLGVNNLGTSNIDATYNSWGSQAGPGSGDGVSSHVLYDPWTNVDLFLGSSGTPWAFQVVKNSNISITVMGDLYRVTGASFKLEYDTSLLDLVSATPTALFNAVPPSGTLLNTATDGVVQYDGIKFTEVTGTDMAFYTLVFKGTATGTAYVRFNQATDLFAMSPTSGPSSNIYANTLTPGSVKIITLPTLNSTDIQGYYLTGDRQEFNISLTNPASGGDFSNVIVKYSVSGLQKADTATFEYNAGGTWVAMGSRSTETYLEDSVLNKVYGEFGLAPLGFPIAAGCSDIPQFRVTFNTAGSYPVTLELVDRLASDAVLATFTSTAVVYAKPVITSPNLAGPYLAGIPQAATLNITNPSPIPAPFNLVLALPEGTTVVYNSVTYPCTSSGCIIPVLLPAASNNFPLTITFNAPYSGPVTATLFDSDWTPTVHELAHLTVDPVIAYANFSLKGTISMQGRTLRAGAQMILAGPTGFAYGPFTATSIEQISKNLSWSLIPQATYTLTTYQPRYLNLIAANNKTALVNGALVFNPLELKGGNCIWTDNEIGVGDASCVGGKYGTGTIADDADVNFDGKVNIQDLALVGGNFYATSQTAYGIGNGSIWIPLP